MMTLRALLAAGLLLLLFALPASAQFTLTPLPQFQAFDNTGRPCTGCLLYSYVAGTSTPQATYTDSTGGTPNTNPVVLDAAGRADVWLGTAAYKLVLKTAGGLTIYSTDNILSSITSLLSTNNTWSGTQIFNGAITVNAAATFGAGLTSSGPNVLNGGGTITGTYLGSPTFSGIPNFAGGIAVTTITISGQLTSTVTTGTAPFVVASTTKVTNLNADLLDGCDWAIPCALGTTTPNTGAFTTLSESAGLTLNGAVSGTQVQGNSGKVQLAGTNSGTLGNTLCNDANGNATDSGCTNPVIRTALKTSSTCTTANTSYAFCSDTLTWSSAFADANYAFSCSGEDAGISGGTPDAPTVNVIAHSATTITVVTQTQRSQTANYTTLSCIGVHP